MIDARHLTFRYPDRPRPALDDVSFAVQGSESVLVLGPSGSGKSTLTLCLDGLIPHLVEGDLEGSISVAGLVTGEHPVRVLAQEVGIVFQDPEAQFCTLTVQDEIAFGLENLLVPPGEIDAIVDEALATVGMTGYGERRLQSLSGGQKQRVALASVLATRPKVLVLDEPSANLDPAGRRQLFALLRELAGSRARTIVIIEHQLDEIMDWIDSVAVLGAHGELLFHGTPRHAFYEMADSLGDAGIWHPRAAVLARGLAEAGWKVPGQPLTVAQAATAICQTPGLGERLRRARQPGPSGAWVSPATCREVVVSVRDLSFAYPGFPEVLHGISFDVAPGELVAVVGQNGAGKSTLAALMSSVLRPPRGTVRVHGRDARSLKASALAAEVGHVFQNPEHQFVADTVRGELAYGLPRARHGGLAPEQHTAVEATLQRFGLESLAGANPFTLSQGQKRRLSVAAMLMRGQSVLVLDEPTFGQDQVRAARLMAMLADLLREGRTVVVVTHDMDLVAEHAHRVLALSEGRLLYAGEPRNFFARDDLIAAAGLGRPALADLSARLAGRPGDGPALLTLADYLSAAGAPPVALALTGAARADES